jgi:ABC-type lipoprotein release transport system permease subunit
MLFLVRLALKNMMRYFKRTLITASAIGFGLGLFLFVDSMLIGAEKDSERNLIWYETASMRIFHQNNIDQYEKMNLKHLIEGSDELVASLRAMNYQVTPRTSFSGDLIIRQDPFPEDGSMSVRVSAIDPQHDADVYHIQESLEPDGQWLTPNGNGVILGAWMAEDIQAKVGYPITVVTRTRDGAYQTLDLEVVGIVNTPNPMVNRYSLIIDQQFADSLLNLGGSVTQIDVAFGVNENVLKLQPVLQADISKIRKDLGVLTWRDLAGSYLSLVASKRSGSSSILGLVFLISLVGITNTMLLAMYERRRELGMLRALGMKNSEIRLLFMFEAAGIGVIGGIAGIIIGLGLVWFIVDVGIDFSFLLRDMDLGYRLASVFRGIWRPEMFYVAFIASVAFSMLVALIPTRQSLKMNITDCLRGDNQ